MDELFKTVRIVQRTILAVSVTLLVFLYPLQSSAPIKAAVEEISALTHILIDLRFYLERIESDGHGRLYTDLNLLFDGQGAKLNDQSWAERSGENPSDYVFVDPGEWVREEDGRRFTDILNDWNSDKLTNLPVYTYQTKQLHDTVASLFDERRKSYLLVSVQRSHSDTKVFLNLTFRSDNASEEAKTVSVPLSIARTVDVQQYFQTVPKSSQVLIDGELCPSLQKMTAQIQGSVLEKAESILYPLLPDSPEKVGFLGVKVDLRGVILFAPPLLLGLFLYLASHLRHIPLVAVGLSAEERIEALRFPWTPLYEGELSRVIEIISLGILPAATMVILVIIQFTSIASSCVFQGFIVLEVLAIIALAGWTIGLVWDAGKSLRQPDTGAEERSSNSPV